MKALPRFRDPKAYWDRPVVDDKGFTRIWLHLERGLPKDHWRGVVFSPEDEYLGRTTTPGWPQPQRGDMLTVREDPESDKNFPVVYRIRPAVDSLEH